MVVDSARRMRTCFSRDARRSMMPTFFDSTADAAEASEALRGLAHASRSFDQPAEMYGVIGDLFSGMRSLRQALDQIAEGLQREEQSGHDLPAFRVCEPAWWQRQLHPAGDALCQVRRDDGRRDRRTRRPCVPENPTRRRTAEAAPGPLSRSHPTRPHQEGAGPDHCVAGDHRAPDHRAPRPLRRRTCDPGRFDRSVGECRRHPPPL